MSYTLMYTQHTNAHSTLYTHTPSYYTLGTHTTYQINTTRTHTCTHLSHTQYLYHTYTPTCPTWHTHNIDPVLVHNVPTFNSAAPASPQLTAS